MDRRDYVWSYYTVSTHDDDDDDDDGIITHYYYCYYSSIILYEVRIIIIIECVLLFFAELEHTHTHTPHASMTNVGTCQWWLIEWHITETGCPQCNRNGILCVWSILHILICVEFACWMRFDRIIFLCLCRVFRFRSETAHDQNMFHFFSIITLTSIRPASQVEVATTKN